MSVELVLFLLFGALAAAGAATVVLHPHPVYSALALVLTLFQIAILFILLDAHMVAFLQVVIYAGAIMVLFLFVIMLLNLQKEPALAPLRWRLTALGVAGVLATELVVLFARNPLRATEGKLASNFGTVEEISAKLFTDHALSFEITSILLLVAVVGSVVMGKRKFE